MKDSLRWWFGVVWLALAICAAQKSFAAFPNGCLKEDTFTRADAGPPLGTNGIVTWTTFRGTGLKIVSNNAQAAAAGGNGDYISSGVIPAGDVVAFETIVTPSTTFGEIFLRLSSPGASLNAYSFIWDNSGSPILQIYKITAGTYVQIGLNRAQTITAGDQLGASVITVGSNVELRTYYKVGAGAWSQIGATETDSSSPFLSAGFAGIAIFGTAGVIGDFTVGPRCASRPFPLSE